MFAEIKELKKLGLNKSQAKRELNINYKTVDKYWDMSPGSYAQLLKEAKSRRKKIDGYKDEILEWLRDFKDISAAQVYDWLRERYGKLNFKERSLRHYISHLRKEFNIPKIAAERPFTTATFVDAHNKAFEYFGGMPVKIVYDQDRILTVSENNGDIIYTEGFQNYINIMKYKVRLCRAFDPESKGKIEAVVKFAKYNFANHRTFIDIDSLNGLTGLVMKKYMKPRKRYQHKCFP